MSIVRFYWGCSAPAAPTAEDANIKDTSITLTVTAKADSDYSGSVSSTFTIAPATPALAWESTTQELTYTGDPAAITEPTVTLVNSESFGGTIHYSYAGTNSGTGLPTNAGTYTVKAHVDAAGNYTAADSGKMTLNINKADVTLTTTPPPVR